MKSKWTIAGDIQIPKTSEMARRVGCRGTERPFRAEQPPAKSSNGGYNKRVSRPRSAFGDHSTTPGIHTMYSTGQRWHNDVMPFTAQYMHTCFTRKVAHEPMHMDFSVCLMIENTCECAVPKSCRNNFQFSCATANNICLDKESIQSDRLATESWKTTLTSPRNSSEYDGELARHCKISVGFSSRRRLAPDAHGADSRRWRFTCGATTTVSLS